MGDNGIEIFKDCDWLRNKPPDRQENLCGRTASSKKPLAKDVCPFTCDTCRTTSPSVAPRSDPSSELSLQPSSGPSSVPSQVPSLLPSSVPSQAPSVSQHPSDYICEDKTSLFYLKTNDNGIEIFKDCDWLRNKPPDRQENLCARTASSKKPLAKDVCPFTCDTCRTTSPSVAPSSAPSSEPSLQPSSGPSSMPSQVPSLLPSSVPSQAPSVSQEP